MKKVAGMLYFLLAISLLLVPAQVFAADSMAQTCTYDTVKWQDNPNSCFLYLNNWGKTPLTAMSRLAGLAYPCILTGLCSTEADKGSCYGACASCNDEVGSLGGCTDPKSCQTVKACPAGNCDLPGGKDSTCKTTATYAQVHCSNRWGVSLAFANKSWAGKDLTSATRVNNAHPDHFGISDRSNPAKGGDWGITGCAHSECGADIWCLPCNMDPNSACTAKKTTTK
jgi:hypothetical protein